MLYPFVPTGYNPEELMVYENDQIEVYDIGADGWVQGRCLRTGMIGLVPRSKCYVLLVMMIMSNRVRLTDYTNLG